MSSTTLSKNGSSSPGLGLILELGETLALGLTLADGDTLALGLTEDDGLILGDADDPALGL